MKPEAITLASGEWARIEPLLPQPARTGRPPRPSRPIVEGILWVLRTRRSWRQLPPSYGPWQTVYHRYTVWRRSGVWQRIEAELSPVEVMG